MKHKSEQLETYVLLSLTKFKNLEQRLQKAENVSILKTDLSTPAESSLPASSPSPAPSVSSEVEMGESSEPSPAPSPPAADESVEPPVAKPVKIGHDL